MSKRDLNLRKSWHEYIGEIPEIFNLYEKLNKSAKKSKVFGLEIVAFEFDQIIEETFDQEVLRDTN